jgi:hypothetical protein
MNTAMWRAHNPQPKYLSELRMAPYKCGALLSSNESELSKVFFMANKDLLIWLF